MQIMKLEDTLAKVKDSADLAVLFKESFEVTPQGLVLVARIGNAQRKRTHNHDYSVVGNVILANAYNALSLSGLDLDAQLIKAGAIAFQEFSAHPFPEDEGKFKVYSAAKEKVIERFRDFFRSQNISKSSKIFEGTYANISEKSREAEKLVQGDEVVSYPDYMNNGMARVLAPYQSAMGFFAAPKKLSSK